MSKITLYHLTKPMYPEQADTFAQDLSIQLPSIAPLGNQSNGFFFFTTEQGANNHARFRQETESLNIDSKTNLYVIRAEVDIKEIKYPVWQLDYEATRNYFFELFLARANISPIKFDDVIVSTDNKILQIQNGKKFMKLREFSPEHSGLIEKIVAHLYYKENSFRNKYNEFLQRIIRGADAEKDTTYFAIKTTKCPRLLSCEKIENTIKPVQSSQITKWYQRYRK